MNEKELEELRGKSLRNFWLLIGLPTVLIVYVLISIICNCGVAKYFTSGNETLYIFVIIVLAIFPYTMAGSITKKYENTVKKYLIKNALKKIPDSDINWETVDEDGYKFSTAEDFGSESQQKWYEKFDDEREVFENKLSMINDDCLKIYDEQYNIEGDKEEEELSEQDKQKLKELDAKLDALDKKEKALKTEQYKKDCEELQKLELTNSDKKEGKNFYKIKYLKEKINEYNEELKMEKISDEFDALEDKNIEGTITEAEKERMESLKKIIDENYEKSSESYENSKSGFYRMSLVASVVDSFISEDDKFWGTYKGKNFIFAEAHDESTKSHAAVFNGTILKIEVNKEYNNKIVALKKVFYSSETWYSNVKKGLKKLKIKLPFYTDYEIYAKKPDNIDSVLNKDFIDFVNTLQDYSYIIENNNLYVIIQHKGDCFKFGSLFKRVDDESQYSSFYKDMNEILKVVEYAGKFGF